MERRETNPACFEGDWHLSRIVEANGLFFLSGVTGCRADCTFSPDPEEQFREAFSFLAEALATARLQIGDIVELTGCHVELRRHLDTFTRVKDDVVLPPFTAWSCIGTTELITSGTLVELGVVAARGGPSVQDGRKRVKR